VIDSELAKEFQVSENFVRKRLKFKGVKLKWELAERGELLCLRSAYYGTKTSYEQIR